MERNEENRKTNKLITVIATILVILIAGFAGWYFASRKFNQKIIANGIVVDINKNANYMSKMLTSYDEYKSIINENGLDLSKNEILKEADFEKRDYIIDYIPYDKDLEVIDIEVEVLDGGVVLHYQVSHEIKDNTQMLLYFIAIDKDRIHNYSLANRTFSYKNK